MTTAFSSVNCDYITFLSAVFLAIMYLPFGFYTLQSVSKKGKAWDISLGLIYSIAFVAMIFGLMKIDLALIPLGFLLTLFFPILIAILIAKFKKEKEFTFFDVARFLTIHIYLFWSFVSL